MNPLPDNATAPIRILVVDDHTLFRRGLTALLARDPQFQVVGDAADAGAAQRCAQELQPDLILLDNHLPGVNGVDALPALSEAAPAARILILTISEDENDLAAALRNGASGYLLKTMEGDALSDAIRRAMLGESVVAQEMTGKLIAAFRNTTAPAPGLDHEAPSPPSSPPSSPQSSLLSSLSPRELDILRCITAGDSNKEIARKLFIAETTVKIHVQHILRKLAVSSRVHAAVMASGCGLV
jgi:two-component system nitrate/nitrite response regulator NarL